MRIEQLKLYNKYKNININNPNIEYIYIGFDKQNSYCFLYKIEDYNLSFTFLKHYGFEPDKIVKELNLEIFYNKYGDKYIKGYCYNWYKKEKIEKYLKPYLKDKINNILNR